MEIRFINLPFLTYNNGDRSSNTFYLYKRKYSLSGFCNILASHTVKCKQQQRLAYSCLSVTRGMEKSGHHIMGHICDTVKALYSRVLYFAVFPMNIISLEFNFADFAFVTLHCQNVHVVFNFEEMVHK